MPLPSYRPTRGSFTEHLLCDNVFTIFFGLLHLVLSISQFLHLATGDSPVKEHAGTIAIPVLEDLASVVFCILLLIGLFKKTKCFVKFYLIYSVVFLILALIGFTVLIFAPSVSMGVTGFFIILLGLMLYLLIFFVVYTYYTLTYCTPNTWRAEEGEPQSIRDL